MSNSPLHEHESDMTRSNEVDMPQDLTIDGINLNNSIMHHRRHRTSRTFKNPPQPHFCIKERTIDGQELFINVMSWSRIANPVNPLEPVPLYGGMRVHPGSPRSPPLVYAVMASPDVLKQAGRKCPDTPERMNLVDLMCEFVEAMNPGLQLSRKPEILKDRDLSGELKDVWNAVQAVRDKEKAGIQHIDSDNMVVYSDFGPESAPSYEQSIASMNYNYQNQNSNMNNNNNKNVPYQHHHHVGQQKTGELNFQQHEIITHHQTQENLHEATANPTNISTENSSPLQTKTNQSAINNITTTNSDTVDAKITALTKETEKVSLTDKSATKTTETNNEKSEKSNVKANNQKNKESQQQQHHHFFPKFVRSSSHSKDKEHKEKDKDKDKDKDKEKDKDKDKDKEANNKNEDDETKVKPKKGLNFFRRNKSSAQTPASPKNTNDKISTSNDNNKEKDENIIIDNNDNKFKKFDDLNDEKSENLVELASMGVGSGNNATAVATVVAK